jgi:hypothetical protein
MFKPAIILIPLVLCSCAPRQDSVAARSDDKPSSDTHNEALYPVKAEGGYGYMDRTGKLVLKGPYAGASRFSEGLAAVQMAKAEKVGYIDTTGKMVIPLQFDLADPFSEGMAAVMQDRRWGYIDKTGKLVIPFNFGAAQPFVNGRAAVINIVNAASQFGYINTKGEFPNEGRYEAAMPYRDGLAAVRSFGERFKYIDMAGKVAIPQQFLSGGEFMEGLSPVQAQTPEGVRWGFIDKQGKMVIPATYTNAGPFAEGLAPVQMLTGKWGFIDAKNTMVLSPQWDQAASFSYGLSQVWSGDKFGYIGKDGKYVWEIK